MGALLDLADRAEAQLLQGLVVQLAAVVLAHPRTRPDSYRNVNLLVNGLVSIREEYAMPWDLFANQLSRYLRITHVAAILSGLTIAAEVTVLALGDNSAEAIRTLWNAKPSTLQLLLLAALTLLAAYLIGSVAQSLAFLLRHFYYRLLKRPAPPEGMATPNAPLCGESAKVALVNRYGEATVKALIAKHPINVCIDKPETLYRASEYSSFWLQRNVPELQQSSLTNRAYVFYAAVVPILLAPFAIDAMQDRNGIMPFTIVLIVLAIGITIVILSRANRMIDRAPTLLVQLFVAYALVADGWPAQPPAEDQGANHGSRGAEGSPKNLLKLYRTFKAALQKAGAPKRPRQDEK
jgi:hypothetical protein